MGNYVSRLTILCFKQYLLIDVSLKIWNSMYVYKYFWNIFHQQPQNVWRKKMQSSNQKLSEIPGNAETWHQTLETLETRENLENLETLATLKLDNEIKWTHPCSHWIQIRYALTLNQ